MPNGQITLSKKIDLLDSKVQQIINILMGDPKDTDKLGLVEKLRNAEKWQRTEKWGLGILAGLLVTDIGSRIVQWLGGK